MKHKCLWLLLCLLSVVLAGCGTAQESRSLGRGETQPVQVNLDIYSGRPNPQWELSTTEEAELSHRLSQLKTSAQDPGEVGLGYRGFLITNDGRVTGIASHIRVFRGTVVITDEKGHHAFYQDTQDIERWLENQARSHGYGNILGSVQQ